MADGNRTIKNPLTVISIFAGLAEISGTGVLPFISETNQATYIYFLMYFPVCLVVLFFLTLNFNAKVLYAPSDFQDEGNYMKLFRPSSALQISSKIRSEIADLKLPESSNAIGSPKAENKRLENSYRSNAQALLKSSIAAYHVAETLVIERLEREFGVPSKRNLTLIGQRSHVYDAIFDLEKGVVVVEVKLISNEMFLRRIKETLYKLERLVQSMPIDVRPRTTAILAIAYTVPELQVRAIAETFGKLSSELPFQVELRMFKLEDLIRESEKESGIQEQK